AAGLTLRSPAQVDLADVDGDGDTDILATWESSDVFTVFPRGAGVFEYAAPSAIQTGVEPAGIKALDIDGDGDIDVVVANSADDSAGVHISYRTDPGVIVDNSDAGAIPVGPWVPSDAPFPFGAGSVFSKDGTRHLWDATLPAPGA